MKYCERLKQARSYAKLTQQQLVDKMGVKKDGTPLMAQPNIAKMELSQAAKGSIYSANIAEACGVSATWLTNEVGDMIKNNYLLDAPATQMVELMENMDTITKYRLIKIGATLTEPAEKPNGTHK